MTAREAITRYCKAAHREMRRVDTLLAKGADAERLRTDVVLRARARTAERLRLQCSPAIIAATQPHADGVKP